MSNIYQIQLLYPSFMLLTGQDLSKAVSRHLIYQDPSDINLFVLDFLSKPVLIYVDMSKLSVQFWYILSQQADSLHIIAQQGKFALYIKANYLKESLPPDNLNSSSRQGEKLRFSSQASYRSLQGCFLINQASKQDKQISLRASSSFCMVCKYCVRCSVKGDVFSLRVSKVDVCSKYFARVFNSCRFCSKTVSNSLVYCVKVFLIWISKEFGQLRMRFSNIRFSKYGQVCKRTDLLLIGQSSLRVCVTVQCGN